MDKTRNNNRNVRQKHGVAKYFSKLKKLPLTLLWNKNQVFSNTMTFKELWPLVCPVSYTNLELVL